MNPAKSSTIHAVRHTGAQLSNIARGDQRQLLKLFRWVVQYASPRVIAPKRRTLPTERRVWTLSGHSNRPFANQVNFLDFSTDR
jgi:hypothetical protein